MGCTTSRIVDEAATKAKGFNTGTENLTAATQIQNAKTKWKGYKAPIDMDLLRELGLLEDDDMTKDKPCTPIREDTQEGNNKGNGQI